MFTKAFWIATVERTVRTGAAVLAGFLTASATGVYSQINWENALITTAYACLGTVLLCLAGSKAGSNEGPSFINEQIVPVPPGK